MRLQQLLYLSLASGLFAACGGSGEQTAANEQTPVQVTLTQAGNPGNGSFIEVSGQLAASKSVAVSTRIMGYITQMPVHMGDNVRAGQLLFSVQSTDIQAKDAQVAAQVTQAEAALANAQKDYERFRVLHRQNSATDKELENVTLQYKAAQAQAEAARQMRKEVNANMAYARVTAPFNGTITQKMIDAGALASPGMPVLVLESNEGVQVNAMLTEEQVRLVHTGMPVTFVPDTREHTIHGTVSEISRSSAGTGGQYLVKINIHDEAGLLSGMYGHVRIPVAGETSPVIRIPLDNLVKQGDLLGIYTVSQNNKAVLRWLRTGSIENGQVEVLSGLTAGEQYISHADGRLWNGVDVKF